jgi:uncharacterized protein YkwD
VTLPVADLSRYPLQYRCRFLPMPMLKHSIALLSASCLTLANFPTALAAPKLIAISTMAGNVTPSAMEREIVVEMNRARTNPRAYAEVARDWRTRFQGDRVKISDRLFLQTKEGVRAVDEAISFLQSTAPVTPLNFSTSLALAARQHQHDQSNNGGIGHIGGDGSSSSQRIARHGRFRLTGENITYGSDSARAVVRDLIIDDGVVDRGHRTNIFQPRFRTAGVACGHHRNYRILCVINYADS